MFRYEDYINFYPWLQCVQVLDNINTDCKKTIAYLIWKVIGESMPAYLPHTTNTGGITKIYFIERKP